MQATDLDTKADAAAELLSAMANPKRLMILCHLLDGEMSVTALGQAVAMNQSALSQQLARLRAMRLVETRRDGQTIYYRVASQEVRRVLETLYGIYCAPDMTAALAAETAG